MRKEFESGLAERVAERRPQRRPFAKVCMALVLGAAVLGVSAVSVTAMYAMNGDAPGDQLTDRDQLRDGSCTDEVCDPACDCTGDCDCNCPYCEGTP